MDTACRGWHDGLREFTECRSGIRGRISVSCFESDSLARCSGVLEAALVIQTQSVDQAVQENLHQHLISTAVIPDPYSLPYSVVVVVSILILASVATHYTHPMQAL
jgi:hypothetical protein